jgi:hypothetical protein
VEEHENTQLEKDGRYKIQIFRRKTSAGNGGAHDKNKCGK